MLILLKQFPTGNTVEDAYGNLVAEYEQIFFDTIAIGLVSNTMRSPMRSFSR
jgi:hypothetical protein